MTPRKSIQQLMYRDANLANVPVIHIFHGSPTKPKPGDVALCGVVKHTKIGDDPRGQLCVMCDLLDKEAK